MLGLFKDFKKNRETRRLLLALFEEIEKNLESCYVMQQRNVFDTFRLEAWTAIKNNTDVTFDEKVLNYGKVFEDYNDTMNDFKDYEKWYASDIKNKSRENGKILHEKRQMAFSKFEGLDKIVKSAKESLEQQRRGLK